MPKLVINGAAEPTLHARSRRGRDRAARRMPVVDWQTLLPPTWNPQTFPVTGLFLLAVFYTLYLTRPLVLPVILAVFLSLLLRPLVRWLARRRIPEPIGALLLLVLLLGTVGAGVAGLADPAREWIRKAPDSLGNVQQKIGQLLQPAQAVSTAAAQVEQAVAPVAAQDVQQVEIKRPGLMGLLLSGTTTVLGGVAIVIGLLYFLLASGDRFLRKWVQVVPSFSEKRRAVIISQEMVRMLSTYLAAITGINIGLGIATGVAMKALGMPNPVLWGVLGGLLNFVPYLGALLGVVVLGLVGFVHFDTAAQAIVPPLVYWAFTMFESSLVTPLVLGRRFELNPVMIFLSLMFWGWLWGIPGTLLAVPILVALKILCDHSKHWQPLGQFLAR